MRRALLPLALVSALLAGGCEAAMVGVAAPMVWRKDHVNLLNASYAAADDLAYSSSHRLKKNTPLIVNTLYEIVPQKDPTAIYPKGKTYENPRLGAVMTDQIRTRFIELGYNVMDGYPGGTGSAAEVNGTYELKGDALSKGTLAISLRLTDKKTGRILGLRDYTLPVTGEIKDYMAEGNLVMPSFMRD